MYVCIYHICLAHSSVHGYLDCVTSRDPSLHQFFGGIYIQKVTPEVFVFPGRPSLLLPTVAMQTSIPSRVHSQLQPDIGNFLVQFPSESKQANKQTMYFISRQSKKCMHIINIYLRF